MTTLNSNPFEALRVGVVGASGKMGKEIVAVLNEKKLIPYYGIYKNNIPTGFAHTAKNFSNAAAKDVDLWIDFSLPEFFNEAMVALRQYKKPIVSGTTGLSEDQKKILNETSKTCPILWSSNMSLGIAVLSEAIECFKKIKHFDFQIEEFHHIKKKDAPSGTAVTLQNRLNEVIDKKAPEPLSVRGGGIFGVHKIWAMSDQEVLMFEHQALNRKVFAEGAVFAGMKLIGKSAGLYGMKDIL